MFVLTVLLCMALETGIGRVSQPDEPNIVQYERFPLLKGAYMGQKPPGMTPEVFAPDLVSTGDFERALVFSPDGREAFFQMRGRGFTTFLIHMQIRDGEWRGPEMASFSGIAGFDDNYPFFSTDGKRLYFSSRRPIERTGEIQKNPDIWVVDRSGGTWGEPERLSDVINSDTEESVPSLASNGNLYFNSERGGDWGIYVSRFVDGLYAQPEKLPPPVDSDVFDGHPFIAPDESYLLFDSNREGGYGDLDIYVSFRKNGEWTDPVNLGAAINTPSHEVAPCVSPDGKYLFFTTFKWNPESHAGRRFDYDGLKRMLASPGNGRGDVYWVDAKIVHALRSQR